MIGYKKTTKFARSSVDKLAPTLPLMTTKVDLLRSKKKKKKLYNQSVGGMHYFAHTRFRNDISGTQAYSILNYLSKFIMLQEFSIGTKSRISR